MRDLPGNSILLVRPGGALAGGIAGVATVALYPVIFRAKIEGYGVRTTVDLTTDRKVAAGIQVVFVAIAVVMVVLALILDFPLSSGTSTWATSVTTVAACLVYMVVHELTHAGLLRLFSGTLPTVAVRLPYLVVGGRGYLNARSFLLVDLAPAIVWASSW